MLPIGVQGIFELDGEDGAEGVELLVGEVEVLPAGYAAEASDALVADLVPGPSVTGTRSARTSPRTGAALGEVRAGASTALAVARALPWTRRLRRLDDLPDQHRMLAVLEIDAHLEVLTEAGVLSWTHVEGVRRFAVRG